MSRKVYSRGTPRARGLVLERVFNIADPKYGGKVDGVSDDTNAWLAAYADALANGGGVVYKPEGDSVIAQTVGPQASGISTAGAGLDAGRVLWKAGVPMPTFGMYAPANPWNQTGNHVRDLTFDANGQNIPAFTTSVGITWAGSHSVWERVAWANRPGTNQAAPNGISETNYLCLVLAHDVTFAHCWGHDDYSVQTATASPIGALSYPSPTSIVLASATGVQIGGYLILDPSVSAFTGNAVAGAGSAAITPRVTHENPWPNGGQTTGMRGIYVGQQLLIDTVASGVQETVTVSAVTVSTFTAPFAHAHAAGVPIAYSGVTETVQVANLVGSTVTATTQRAHNANVAVLTIPMTSDGIGIGHAHITAQTQATLARRIKIHDGRFDRLGLDGSGWATIDGINFHDNVVSDCIFGIIMQDSHSQHVHDNTFDASGLGLMPAVTTVAGAVTPAAGPNFAGISLFNEAPEFSAAPFDAHIHNNTVRGYSYGILRCNTTGSTVINDGVTIADNHLYNQGINALVLAGLTNSSVHGNTIRNPNRAEWASDPTVGSGSVGAILVLAANAQQTVDGLEIYSNHIVADPSVYSDAASHMHAGIVGGGTNGNWGTVRAYNNYIKNNTATAIQWAAGFPIQCWGNGPLFEPRAGAVASPSIGSSPAAIVNNSGFDAMYFITTAGVTFTALSVTNAAGGSAANTSTVGLLKHGCTLNVAWSAGSPALTLYYL